MAGSADIKNRIKGIQDTKKITNAMYLISSTKLRRAKKSMEDIEPYYYGLQNLMQRMMRHFPISGPDGMTLLTSFMQPPARIWQITRM